ncbi:unnamed protein product [Alopecurus aequalis]
MAAALRVFRRRPGAPSARILPPWLPRTSPKLYAAAAASSLPHARGVHSSPTLVPSVLRRYWSARSPGGNAASVHASVHRAHSSPLQKPSLLPVRHHGSTSNKQLNSLEYIEAEEALASPHDALRKLQRIDKSVKRMKRELWIMIGLLALPAYLFYRMFFLLMVEVGILEWRVEELEKP